jgi:hypothetical protein
MVVMGGLAILNTPLVGMPPSALLSMNPMHGGVHALGGVIAIGIGLFLRGHARAYGVLTYGALFVFGFVANLISPDFFGTMPDAPANAAIHVMHALVALISVGTGYAVLSAARPSQQGERAS